MSKLDKWDRENVINWVGAILLLAVVIVGLLCSMMFWHSIDTDAKMKLYCVQHGKGVDVQYNRNGGSYVAGCK